MEFQQDSQWKGGVGLDGQIEQGVVSVTMETDTEIFWKLLSFN